MYNFLELTNCNVFIAFCLFPGAKAGDQIWRALIPSRKPTTMEEAPRCRAVHDCLLCGCWGALQRAFLQVCLEASPLPSPWRGAIMSHAERHLPKHWKCSKTLTSHPKSWHGGLRVQWNVEWRCKWQWSVWRCLQSSCAGCLAVPGPSYVQRQVAQLVSAAFCARMLSKYLSLGGEWWWGAPSAVQCEGDGWASSSLKLLLHFLG